LPVNPREAPGTAPSATPATLTELASDVDLGPLDGQTALIVKVCEAQQQTKYEKMLSERDSKLAALSAQYDATLRELRDKLDAIRLDDFVKVGFGLLAGIVIRRLTEVGSDAFTEPWVNYSMLGLFLSFAFLLVRWIGPSTRRNEVKAEIKARASANKTS
jgi:hypothetical protein